MKKNFLKFTAVILAVVSLSSNKVLTYGDQDQDGVEDSVDRCPNTPIGIPVDAYGCPFFI